MSHELHLIVVKAIDGKEAMGKAESFIEDWGDENNWRHFCGAVSEDNVVTIGEEGGDWLDDSCNTIEKINEMVKRNLRSQLNDISIDDFNNTIKILKQYIIDKKIKDPEGFVYGNYNVYELNHVYDLVWSLLYNKIYDIDKFDILKDEFLCVEYDEFGVTDYYPNDKDEGKLHVVFVDMQYRTKLWDIRWKKDICRKVPCGCFNKHVID